MRAARVEGGDGDGEKRRWWRRRGAWSTVGATLHGVAKCGSKRAVPAASPVSASSAYQCPPRVLNACQRAVSPVHVHLCVCVCVHVVLCVWERHSSLLRPGQNELPSAAGCGVGGERGRGRPRPPASGASAAGRQPDLRRAAAPLPVPPPRMEGNHAARWCQAPHWRYVFMQSCNERVAAALVAVEWGVLTLWGVRWRQPGRRGRRVAARVRCSASPRSRWAPPT